MVIVVNFGLSSCYLLKCKGGYLLVDTSYRKNFTAFKNKLKSLNISLKDIKYILITHYHHDHTGFVNNILEEVNSKLILHSNCVRYLKSNSLKPAGIPLNNMIKALRKVNSIIDKEDNTPTIDIKDGDIIICQDNSDILKSIGIHCEIIYTPGHTDDSISILLEDGNAFVGDLIMNTGFMFNNGYKPILYEDLNLVRESICRLKEKGAKMVYPSHGSGVSIYNLSKLCMYEKS